MNTPAMSWSSPGTPGSPAELSELDRAFARYVSRGLSEAHAPLLYHTAALVSAERALGNSCVELALYAGQAVVGTPEAFTFPDPHSWTEALRASGRCEVIDGGVAAPDDLTPLVLEHGRLYLRRYHAAECRLARAIRSRLYRTHGGVAALEPSAPLFRRLFPDASHGADWQGVAAVAALRSSLVFVTGGPGTGKTTVAARLLALLLDRDPTLDIAVAAPTGRAAARLTEAIGAAVQREQLGDIVSGRVVSAGTTLHRLLGYQPWNDGFRYRAEHPLPHDVIIVDEASMVDVLMMDALFAAARESARIIVLGDPDQLASVDTGFVLGDVARAALLAGGDQPERHSEHLANDYALLGGGEAALLEPQQRAGALRDAVVQLRVSYRFGARPGIGALATAVQESRADDALAVLADTQRPDVAFDPPGSVESLLAPLRPQLDAYLASDTPQQALETLAQFRLLCARRDGEDGVTGVNALVEAWLQRQGRDVEGWYDHRPVLVTANDATTRLFNGDVGTTLAVDGVPLVHFPGPHGTVRSFTPARLPAHETAWAMTVHKSQGSEFDHVRVVLPSSDSRLLTRELLYTAITRARQRVSLVGVPAIVRLATQRSVTRASGLVHRLVDHS